METRSTSRKTPPRKQLDLSLSRVRAAVTNGSSIIPDTDHRSSQMRRLRDLLHAHFSDLGGEAELSEGQKSLVRRAAVLELQLELTERRWATEHNGQASPRALDRYQRVCNTLRRTLEALGVHQGRKARDITPNATARGIEIIRAAASR